MLQGATRHVSAKQVSKFGKITQHSSSLSTALTGHELRAVAQQALSGSSKNKNAIPVESHQ